MKTIDEAASKPAAPVSSKGLMFTTTTIEPRKSPVKQEQESSQHSPRAAENIQKIQKKVLGPLRVIKKIQFSSLQPNEEYEEKTIRERMGYKQGR